MSGNIAIAFNLEVSVSNPVGSAPTPIPAGSFVAAFDESANLAGRGQVTGGSTTGQVLFQAYQDNPSTPEDDGLTLGEGYVLWVAVPDGMGGFTFYQPGTNGSGTYSGAVAPFPFQTVPAGGAGTEPVVDNDGPNDIAAFLPVEFARFDGSFQNGSVELEWATASELNSDVFVVERSENGTRFSEIGKVDAAGESDDLLEYSFTDANPISGAAYYRLREIDLDGTEMFSDIILVRSSDKEVTVEVFPNPTAESITIRGAEDFTTGTTIDFYAADGRLVKTVVPTIGTQIQVDLSDLTTGMYLIRIGNGRSQQTMTIQKL